MNLIEFPNTAIKFENIPPFHCRHNHVNFTLYFLSYLSNVLGYHVQVGSL